ncbi:MAG: hypothetical protein K2Q18_02540, partial [Bdellovibrionales bacterium]|nr:hypothetical protein [Bdellovibrionales bacterium]
VIDMSTKIGDGGDLDAETINCFIFLKKVLVGGEEEVVTTTELRDLIEKLPRLLNLVFDVYYAKSENFNGPSEEMKFYLISTRNFYNSVNFYQPDFELINSKELVTVAEKFIKNYDVKTFQPSIEALKVRFVGGKPDSITLKDLEIVTNMVHDFFEKSYFNNITYEDVGNKTLLAKPTPIKDKELVFKSITGYELFPYQARLDQLFASFKETAVTFRYFRDSSKSALYDTAYSRNAKGFNEVNIATWVSAKLLKAYGTPDPKGVMQLSMDQFSKFLLDAKPILVELKLWSPNFTSFSRNAVLLADLFQQQSNGDQLINLYEGTEYIGMLLTAVDVSGQFSENLTSLCDPGINTDDPVYDTSCYNQNFYNVMLNKLGFKKSFPRLDKYFHTVSREESMNYLNGVEGFARDDNTPGVLVNRRDSTLIIGALINIETTFIRFDKNKDNIIDYDELSEAFFTYKNSIISLAELGPDKVQYAKSIFLYMVSKMEIPPTGTILTDLKFKAFDTCVNWDFCRNNTMDPVVAKRLNIGKLLYYMVNQVPSSTPPTPPKK